MRRRLRSLAHRWQWKLTGVVASITIFEGCDPEIQDLWTTVIQDSSTAVISSFSDLLTGIIEGLAQGAA